MGESFKIDDINVKLDDTMVSYIKTAIEASVNDYYIFVVDVDSRSNFIGDGLTEDVSKHVVMFDGNTFTSYGRQTNKYKL